MSTNFPLISVIVPIYNSEKFIEETLINIKKQNYPSLEIIVVDDGSSDKSAEIIKIQKDIHYYYQENKGPSSARNLGLKNSNGEYIIFLDSDDYWEDNSLLLLANQLNNFPSIQIIEGKIREFQKEENSATYIFDDTPYYMSNFGSCMFRKSVFNQVGIFEEKLLCSEDIDWFTRAWENNITKERIDVVILNYRKHNDSHSAKQGKTQFYRLLLFKLKIERDKKRNYTPQGILIDYIGKR